MTHSSTIRPTRRQAALGLTALTVLSLTACVGSDSGAKESGTDSSDGVGPSDSGGGSGDGAGSGDGDGQDPAAQDDISTSTAVDRADAIATLSYPVPTQGIEGTITVGLHHLRVRGRTMELLLSFTPEYSGNDTYNLFELHGKNGNNLWPILFDRANLKRYDVLKADSSPWFTEDQAFEIASGDTQPFWANFAAPQDDIEVLDVSISTGPAFEDVPIDWGSADPSGGAGGEDGTGGEDGKE